MSRPSAAAPFAIGLRVYYEDTDAGGVVYHAGYLRFAERARTEALRAAGVPHEALRRDHALLFMVQRIEVEYLRPARLDDELTVTVEGVRLGAASIAIRQSVRRDGTVLAALGVRLACVTEATGRPARIPPRWIAALDAAYGVGADAAAGSVIPAGARMRRAARGPERRS